MPGAQADTDSALRVDISDWARDADLRGAAVSVIGTIIAESIKARIDKLEGDLARVSAELADNRKELATRVQWAEYQKVKDERDAALADARRLDWIFSVLDDDVIRRKVSLVSDAHASGGVEGLLRGKPIRVGDYRAAIDDAMQERDDA